ncbi:winged helix-turn-helix domain-containing protein [Paenibacillus hexagrammi]|uniref:Helix-turn-helix domain-containing protein n=1 Tax=Paenibacillus hexagrammi TaxID=2908839 RepID=A0ABY3SD79_9BACL|nr:winged helix-turn-helix domain-containing protein [Paenibacillus sp. YPD9-1]UJF31440.1 helix-turn-helix domain-containing protein [Paenibacillus sp. YPD9-1]
MTRDYGVELDGLKTQLAELQEMVKQIAKNSSSKETRTKEDDDQSGRFLVDNNTGQGNLGELFFSGQYLGEKSRYRWEPHGRDVKQLVDLDSDKVAKILSALGHKQRIDILKAVLQQPLTGAELVDRLNMGTTGQLYHHIKALLELTS